MPVPTLISIAITTPATKLNYLVGESLDITGLVLTGTYSDASTAPLSITTSNVSGFNSSSITNGQVLTISDGGFTTTYSVNIASAQTTLPYNLTTKAKVKLLVGISGTSQDSLLDYLCNSVSDFIQGYCGHRNFLSQTYTDEIYDSDLNRGTKGGSCLFLHQYPITTLTKIEYRSGTITNPAWVVYDPNSYILYGNSGFIRFYAILPKISQGLRFTYVAGYKIDFLNEFDNTKHNLPFDLTACATEMVAKAYQLRQSQGLKQASVEGQSVVFDNLLTADQKAVLKKYSTQRMAI